MMSDLISKREIFTNIDLGSGGLGKKKTNLKIRRKQLMDGTLFYLSKLKNDKALKFECMTYKTRSS